MKIPFEILNQYVSRTVPGNVQVHGEADAAAVVTVNENPTWRSGEYFYGGDYADNTRTATNKQVEIVAVLPAATPGGEDEIAAVTGRVFVAKTPEVFTYDADGNMTGDGRFTYNWNDENRMVSASNAEVCVTYAYDHKGRMIRKTIMRTGSDTVYVEYTWDGWNIIREVVREDDSVAVADNLWGLDLDGTMQGAGGVGGLLAVIRDGETYIPTYDANGNISEYVDSSTGSVAAHYDYSPFGETLVASGSLAAEFTHRFSTKPWCGETKLLEYQYRKYNPNLGRWMSRDPIGEKGGPCLYEFSCNAMRIYDYLGLSCCKIGATRNCKVGITTVRTGGDPNIDESYQDYLNGIQSYDDGTFVLDAAKHILLFMANGTQAAMDALTEFLISQMSLSPGDVAEIGQNLLDFYSQRGKVTTGVAIWTRVCYERCEPFLALWEKWEEKCTKWEKYEYTAGKDKSSFFASDIDASAYAGKAIQQAQSKCPPSQ